MVAEGERFDDGHLGLISPEIEARLEDSIVGPLKGIGR